MLRGLGSSGTSAPPPAPDLGFAPTAPSVPILLAWSRGGSRPCTPQASLSAFSLQGLERRRPQELLPRDPWQRCGQS